MTIREDDKMCGVGIVRSEVSADGKRTVKCPICSFSITLMRKGAEDKHGTLGLAFGVSEEIWLAINGANWEMLLSDHIKTHTTVQVTKFIHALDDKIADLEANLEAYIEFCKFLQSCNRNMTLKDILTAARNQHVNIPPRLAKGF